MISNIYKSGNRVYFKYKGRGYSFLLYPHCWSTWGPLYYYNPWGPNLGVNHFFHHSKWYRDLIYKHK